MWGYRQVACDIAPARFGYRELRKPKVYAKCLARIVELEEKVSPSAAAANVAGGTYRVNRVDQRKPIGSMHSQPPWKESAECEAVL
jgi:hypothetical protein